MNRAMENRRPISGLRVVLGAVAVAAIVLALLCFAKIRFDPQRRIDVYRRELLYKTDHRAVLAAARSLMKLAEKAPDKSYTWVRGDPRLPAALTTLEPLSVSADPDQATIQVAGGFSYFGFHASRKDPSKPSYAPDRSGMLVEKMIIPGLWYFDESGRIPSP